MRVSVQLPTCTEGLVNPVPFAVAPADFIRLAQAAERLGFDGVWGNDHVTAAPYVKQHWSEAPNFYEVLVTLATVGAHTERVHLGTAVIVLPLRDPVLLAKQVATLDRMTGGRVILGVGIGAYREEFEAQWPRRRAARRGDLMDEGLAALRLLFTEREASYAGAHVAFERVELAPKPVQRPLPIYVGGHNETAVSRAARLGQGWLPGWRPFDEVKTRTALLRRLTAEAGRDPKEVEAAVQFTVMLGATPEDAAARYRQTGMVRHRRSLAHTGRDPALAEANNLIGSPASLLEKLEFLAAAGVDHVCALQFPHDSVAEMLEQMEWFAKDVIGVFRGKR
ncbi:MAG: TIGR03619 family F420-dependent LLM class oxidoreductase [Candidatus Rokubacteria bacterium]|nr:TIGR03619 family F420-dependent LLM class oxidoreductase [Candidatus Rokubacteria bacterium]